MFCISNSLLGAAKDKQVKLSVNGNKADQPLTPQSISMPGR